MPCGHRNFWLHRRFWTAGRPNLHCHVRDGCGALIVVATCSAKGILVLGLGGILIELCLYIYMYINIYIYYLYIYIYYTVITFKYTDFKIYEQVF